METVLLSLAGRPGRFCDHEVERELLAAGIAVYSLVGRLAQVDAAGSRSSLVGRIGPLTLVRMDDCYRITGNLPDNVAGALSCPRLTVGGYSRGNCLRIATTQEALNHLAGQLRKHGPGGLPEDEDAHEPDRATLRLLRKIALVRVKCHPGWSILDVTAWLTDLIQGTGECLLEAKLDELLNKLPETAQVERTGE